MLVTVVLEVGGLGVDAGGGSGETFSCFSARLSGNFSFTSASGSGFSFYKAQRVHFLSMYIFTQQAQEKYEPLCNLWCFLDAAQTHCVAKYKKPNNDMRILKEQGYF